MIRMMLLQLRRDRLIMAIWILGIALLTLGSVGAIVGTYATVHDRQEVLTLALATPSVLALRGLPDGNAMGSMLMFELFTYLAVVVGLMNTFFATRHGRADEERGRRELVGSTPVGRTTPLAATRTPDPDDVHDSTELDDDVEDVPKPPVLPPPKKKNTGMVVEDAALKSAVLEAQKRAVTERVPALADPTEKAEAQKRAATARVTALEGFDEQDDDAPRAVAIPAQRRRQRQFAVVWAVIFASAAALVMLVIVYMRRQAADQRLVVEQRVPIEVAVPPPTRARK